MNPFVGEADGNHRIGFWNQWKHTATRWQIIQLMMYDEEIRYIFQYSNYLTIYIGRFNPLACSPSEVVRSYKYYRVSKHLGWVISHVTRPLPPQESADAEETDGRASMPRLGLQPTILMSVQCRRKHFVALAAQPPWPAKIKLKPMSSGTGCAQQSRSPNIMLMSRMQLSILWRKH
jgi:hypothetical protein